MNAGMKAFLLGQYSDLTKEKGTGDLGVEIVSLSDKIEALLPKDLDPSLLGLALATLAGDLLGSAKHEHAGCSCVQTSEHLLALSAHYAELQTKN